MVLNLKYIPLHFWDNLEGSFNCTLLGRIPAKSLTRLNSSAIMIRNKGEQDQVDTLKSQRKIFKITYLNNIDSYGYEGDDWFLIARKAGFQIPSGCLTGSCGACEIDLNRQTVRPLLTSIMHKNECSLKVSLTSDPFFGI